MREKLVVFIVILSIILLFYIYNEFFINKHHESFILEGFSLKNDPSLPDKYIEGEYGGINTYIYENINEKLPQKDNAIYVHNSNTWWKENNRPRELSQWKKNSKIYNKLFS